MPRDSTNHEASDSSARTFGRRQVLALTGGTLATVPLVGSASAQDTTTQVSLDEPLGTESPGSRIAPADGFASTEWLTDQPLEVVRVTNLNNNGPGSLRYALEERSEPRVIVFEVGGVIDLEGEYIDATDREASDVFVAGQTAPGPGITTIRGTILIDDENQIVQHIRSRSGDEILGEGSSGEGASAGSIDVGEHGRNIVIDHCSATWATDENMSASADSVDVTFSNNIIAEGLAFADVHPEDGEHSNGTLVGNNAEDVAILGNLYANNNDRHPRLKGGTSSVVVNNVTYNFDDAVRLGGGVDARTASSIVANVYRPGDNTPRDEPVVFTQVDSGAGSIEIFVSGNVTQGPLSMVADDTPMELLGSRPVWPETLDPVGSDRAFGHTLNTAGARPAQRTHHDERIVHDTRSKQGSIIDSQSEVGGYPEFGPVTRELDVPAEDFGAWLYEYTRRVEGGGAGRGRGRRGGRGNGAANHGNGRPNRGR